MKQIYRNPIFYYILIPVVVGLWPLLSRSIYLPKAQANWQEEKTQYDKARKIIIEILSIDPDRLGFAASKANAAEFDYADVIEKTARQCNISPTNYSLSSKPIRASGGQKSQRCRVVLKQVDITGIAKFLSTVQLRWQNLQCEKITLTKKKGLPDAWKAELSFKYYY